MQKSMTGRIGSLDSIRGMALIGTLLSHSILFHAKTMDISSVDSYVRLLVVLFIDTKFVAIFSFLFGYGSFLFINKTKKNNMNCTILYSRRLLVLFPIGVVIYAINPHIAPILLLYVVFGLLLMPFFKKKNHTIGVAIILLFFLDAVVIFTMDNSFFVHYCLVMFTMMLLGYYVARLEIVNKIKEYKKQLITINICSGFISFVCTGAATVQYKKNELIRYENNFVELATLHMSIFYLTTLFWIFRKRKIGILAKYGRLSLTNYIVQSVAIIFIARMMPPFTQPTAFFITLCLIICMIIMQLIFSAIWLKYYMYGPVEFVWNWYTYGYSMKRKEEQVKKERLS
jgi:uncharacterized protein